VTVAGAVWEPEMPAPAETEKPGPRAYFMADEEAEF
jgi:hypothetical protein